MSVSGGGLRGVMAVGLTAGGVGVAGGATGTTIAANADAGVVVGIATLITRVAGEEGGGGGTVIAGLAGGTACGDADPNVGALASHGDSALAIGGEGTWDSDRSDGGDAVDGGAGGVNDRAMATRSSGRAPSLDSCGGGGGSGPTGAWGGICMTEIGSLLGAGMPEGAIGT